MNQTISELKTRKSVRVFTEKPITPEQKKEILLSAMAAPTAGNQQLYTILDITSQELKEQLAETCDHQPELLLYDRLNPQAEDWRLHKVLSHPSNTDKSLLQ